MTMPVNSRQLTHLPTATAAMLIRRPAAEVFEAFIDPAITSKFWFTKSSGMLEPGADIQWDWEMYNFSTRVNVKEIEQNRRIIIEWSLYGAITTVEWRFVHRVDDTTFVSITEAGFSGNGDEIVKQAIESTEGFTLVLSGLKALLEHNIVLNLVLDRYPAGIEEN
jgi:uncharacterized protein YndB with AHSA1/START domain